MRVLLLSPRHADPSQRAVGRALRTLGVDLTVLVPERWRGPVTGEIHLPSFGDDAGVRIVPIPVRGDPGDADRLRWKRSTLRKAVRDARPELVHVESEPWSSAAIHALGAAKSIGVPTTLQAAASVQVALSIGERWRRGRVLRGLRGHAGINEHALRLLGDTTVPVVLPDQPTTLPLRIVRVPHEGLSIGFVGRLVPERGCDLLLEACLRLRGPWTLTIAGTGPSQEQLEALAERLGIASRIRWLGGIPSDKLDDLWPTLDVVALPARTTDRWIEASGALLRVAMAHGVAVIASTSGALPEVVGSAGLLVAEQNAAALADALQRLADDPEELERLGNAARARIMRDFVAEAIGRRMITFWERVLSGQSSGG